MNEAMTVVASEAASLAAKLPLSVVRSVAESLWLGREGVWESVRARAIGSIPHPYYRSLVARSLGRCACEEGEVSAQMVASALLAAAQIIETQRGEPVIELVWTGPTSSSGPVRRTEQAILQVIDSATGTVLVVSYLVYDVPRIAQALVRAADRGVELFVILDNPDPLAGRQAQDTIHGLGDLVASRCHVYYWPQERRPRGPNGTPARLHVKCVAADRSLIFLSSANLTEQALTTNMELGVLIRGGRLASEVTGHFDDLISRGVLCRI